MTAEEQAQKILNSIIEVAESLSVIDSQIFWAFIEGHAKIERNKRLIGLNNPVPLKNSD